MIDADTLRESLIAHISGFKPATTGLVCDLCNAGFVEGDEVLVDAYFGDDGWRLVRTYCVHHGDEPPSTGPSAVVCCEIGAVIDGEWAPLYNPEVRNTRQELDA